jgi:hypothetical protein
MSTHDRFLTLIRRGPVIRGSYSGQLFDKIDMKRDGKGGFLARKFRIKQPGQKSDFREGPGWQRGFN